MKRKRLRLVAPLAAALLGVANLCHAAPGVPSQLLNISTRLPMLGGDNVLIGGFIVTGNAPKRGNL